MPSIACIQRGRAPYLGIAEGLGSAPLSPAPSGRPNIGSPKAILRAAQGRGLTIAAADGFLSLTGMGLGAPVDGPRTLVDADRLFRSKSIPIDALETQGAAIGQRGRPLYAAIDGLAAVIGVSDR